MRCMSRGSWDKRRLEVTINDLLFSFSQTLGCATIRGIAMFSLGILTISTRSYSGTEEDLSGATIKRVLGSAGYTLQRQEIVPDDKEMITKNLVRWADTEQLDLVVTSGGTGLSARDVTPEALSLVIVREVAGLSEAMRVQTFRKTPMSMLSRSIAGTRGRTLIVALPGSPKAVEECLRVIMPVLSHALEVLSDEVVGHSGDFKTGA